jgi:hypothetical protein
LDGSKYNRDGRPEVTFYSPDLPNLGKATIKTIMATTMITGSTAAEEPMPPHFQFSKMAQSENTQRENIRMSTFFPKIRGKFETDGKKEWPVTLAMNLKCGMDEREFRSNFQILLCHCSWMLMILQVRESLSRLIVTQAEWS